MTRWYKMPHQSTIWEFLMKGAAWWYFLSRSWACEAHGFERGPAYPHQVHQRWWLYLQPLRWVWPDWCILDHHPVRAIHGQTQAKSPSSYSYYSWDDSEGEETRQWDPRVGISLYRTYTPPQSIVYNSGLENKTKSEGAWKKKEAGLSWSRLLNKASRHEMNCHPKGVKANHQRNK